MIFSMKKHRLSRSNKDAVRKMQKQGYEYSSKNERRLFMILGSQDFKKIINDSFEYAYLEADF